MEQKKELFILSPFEIPDLSLVLHTMKTDAYPVLHLGRNRSVAEESLAFISNATTKSFGVCIVSDMPTTIELPSNVDKIIYPFGVAVPNNRNIEKYCQIHSVEEARMAVDAGLKNLVVKGNEGAGKVGYKSSFILFQRIMKEFSPKEINIYIQGGIGIHTSAAALALGVKGVIMDSQLVLLPECSVPQELKTLCKSLSGSETTVIDNYRVLIRNNSPQLPVNPDLSHLSPFLGGYDINKNLIPMGQDIALSIDFTEKYKTLSNFVSSFHEAVYGHIQQAKELQTIQADSKLAKELNIKYPIAQGPMARVSDVPEFARNIADAGALPFIALSLAKGAAMKELIDETRKKLDSQTWGVGILGFLPASLREEQTKYILETKPPVVLIAGGRPSLAKPFEKEGIKVFLHVPAPSLLDLFLKENACNFIFEGRESGGHIGPLSSLVLWERQLYRLLKEEDSSPFSVFFAGGIHDAFSSAFITIMTATLAAKGAKIGVLMGSSYIFTKEAVTSGAIVPEFQRQAIAENQTVILEASLGQETRSLKSPFTVFFQEEKKRLQTLHADSKEVWLRLEDLNLGRLRVAAKGIERVGTNLVRLNDKEQVEKGLYMMGQIASMHRDIITLEELHTQVAVDSCKLLTGIVEQPLPETQAKPLNVAVVGISCIFPDAKNTEEFWRNIVTGKNSITEVPDSRWNKDLYYHPDTRDTDYVSSKWGGFIPTIDFDPLEFGMTPQSLASIEPTQLLSLLVAKRALTDAGYSDLNTVDLDNTSVIFGAEGATELAASYGFRANAKQVFGELPDSVKNSLPRLNEDSFAGVLSNVISGRIANRLDLGGRNYTVDAACASSLAALDLGCQELHSEKSDMVLLGGADLHNGINDFLMFSCTHALSKKGYSASFDADSDGIALGEGIAVLVMKRLEDAERDGNKIYAVIKGIGGSSDGKSLGMTAPNRAGQVKALQRAYKAAGILPSQVGMVEAHGTGTVVGDRTELRALTDMFLESGAVKGQSLLGSVKTQIGHAKCAAGIAGIVKTALSLYYGIHPPTLHLNRPNSYYDKNSSPFVFNTQSGIWNSKHRIAGVSSFGFGGTNFHVVMENHHKMPEYTACMPLWPSELFVFRGDSLEEANRLLQNVGTLLAYNDTVSIKDIAYSLSVYHEKEIQVSIVAGDSKELAIKINAALEGKNEQGIYFKNKKEGKLAFMFSGQGSQRINMARDLFVAFPSMRNLLSLHPEYEKIIFPNAAFDDETKKQQQERVTDTRNAQPLLGIVDYAIADFLRSLDIVPDSVAGHSYGELPALCFSGAFAPEDLIPLSRKRALAILDSIEEDKGKMVAVSLPEAELNVLLEGEKEVWAVNYNSYTQTVLAGSSSGITAFIQKLKQKNITYKEFPVACAFHSPLLRKSKVLYADVLKKVNFNSPLLPVWSNTTAKCYPEKSSDVKIQLSEHLIKPVLFTKQVENMYNDGTSVFVEVGPGKILTGLVQSILGDQVITIDTENKSFNGVSYLMHAIAKYLSTGRSAHIEKLFDKRNASVVDLDHPEKYQKKSTIWYINGHNAVPANGKMPANGAYPITQPLMNLNNMNTNSSNNNNFSDQVILEYLYSMRTMLQSQHDVMMRYLGHNSSTGSVLISQPMQQLQVPAPTIAPTPIQAVPQTTQVHTLEMDNTPEPEMRDIKALLLEIVSEKTGYPTDMLGLNLDLEADLSIDSIKRIEIIGALRDKLNITGSFEDSEGAIEKMAAVKTLNGLIEWMSDLAHVNKDQKDQLSGEIQQKEEEVKENIQKENPIEHELVRMDFELEERIINTSGLSIEGKRFALTNDGGTFASGIKTQMEKKGALVDLITENEDLTPYDGLIILNASQSPEKYNIKQMFELVKSADFSKIKWIYSFSDLLGSLQGVASLSGLKEIQGFPGMIKSLAHEFPETSFRAVVFHSVFDEKSLPNIVIDELLTEELVCKEIIYQETKRYGSIPRLNQLSVEGAPYHAIDDNSVIVVFGGAQGITPDLLTALSKDYPCHYVLVGRSEKPTAEHVKYESLLTKDKIRQYLIVEEQMKSPAEIERKVQKIFKVNQIKTTVEKLEKAGAKVTYESLDIKDEPLLREFIRKTYEKYGKIDGIFHAAGLLDDKLFMHKTLESFNKVYATKITPLHVLLDEMRPDLKLFVLFSSVASVYGNKGQIDYASANSVFDLIAPVLSEKTDTRILTINWGPWKGAGMVSDSLEAEFKKRGVSLISLEAGAQYFVNELKYGKNDHVLVMGGVEDIKSFLNA